MAIADINQAYNQLQNKEDALANAKQQVELAEQALLDAANETFIRPDDTTNAAFARGGGRIYRFNFGASDGSIDAVRVVPEPLDAPEIEDEPDPA